jgi:hypothetical protein
MEHITKPIQTAIKELKKRAHSVMVSAQVKEDLASNGVTSFGEIQIVGSPRLADAEAWVCDAARNILARVKLGKPAEAAPPLETTNAASALDGTTQPVENSSDARGIPVTPGEQQP